VVGKRRSDEVAQMLKEVGRFAEVTARLKRKVEKKLQQGKGWCT
jgi:hypothetical protein